MKTLIGFLIGLAVLLAGIAIRYFLLRQREKRAQREGVAVYATVVGIEPETFLGKPSPAFKIRMWIQEPGAERREVSFSTRIPVGQKVDPGMMMPVVVDPSNPKRIYPAGPDAVKRVQYTGSREQRRQMRRKL
jgi:hypothetical protein